MTTDRRIQDAINAGESNKKNIELIQNWCSHARVVKAGGTGLVEMQTGLPIGHHSIQCGFAVASGFAGWDLGEVALDFHDRNCAECKQRSPVRLPNLTQLLQARDEARKRKQTQKDAWEKDSADRLKARQEVRKVLRTQLKPLSITIVDQLDFLDLERSDNARNTLLETTKLAPEVFTPPLVEHFFHLLESREQWFDEVGLQLLKHLNFDAKRLTKCALLCLAGHSATGIASTIVEANVANVDTSLIAAALPSLIYLARPRRSPFSDHAPRYVPGPLLALHGTHPRDVELAIGNMLSEQRSSLVSDGARSILALAAHDLSIAARFARSVAAKLARGERMFSDDDEHNRDECEHELRRALAKALEQAPEQSDALVLNFLEGAGDSGQALLLSAYREVLRGRWRQEQVFTLTPAHGVAFKRLLWAAITTENPEVLREIQSTFGGSPGDFKPLICQEIDALLGAAVLLDDKLEAPPPQRAVIVNNPLAGMEEMNRRNSLYQLQSNFIRWAAVAAAGDKTASEKYVLFLTSIPSEKDRIRAQLIEQAEPIVDTSDGIGLFLPIIYSAMVGAPTRLRAAAASLLGKLDRRQREDLPQLLLEALIRQLSDPFKIVHQTASKTVGKFDVPEEIAETTRLAHWNLILAYANDEQGGEFLLHCIGQYIRRYANQDQLRGALGKVFIALLTRIDPHTVARELRFLGRSLRENEDFVSLTLHLVSDQDALRYEQDQIFATMNDLPANAVSASREKIGAVARSMAGGRLLSSAFIEVLTRASAWEEAVKIAEATHSKIPDSNWDRPQRLTAYLDVVATKYEQAIASGGMERLPALANEWRETLTAIEKDRTTNAEKRDPLRGFLGTY